MLEKIKVLIGGAVMIGVIALCIALGIESTIAITLILVAALLGYGIILTKIENSAKAKAGEAENAPADCDEEPGDAQDETEAQ